MYKAVVIVAVVACTVNLETYFNQNVDEEVFLKVRLWKSVKKERKFLKGSRANKSHLLYSSYHTTFG